MNIFKILFNGIGLYLKNFITLTQVMLFPVLGQVFGAGFIFAVSYYYRLNLPSLIDSNPLFESIPLVFLLLILMVIPGLFIFLKAFWEYMIVTVSLNSIVYDILKNKEIKNLITYAQNIKSRTKDYIIVLSLLSLIWIIGLFIPIIWLFTNIDESIKPFLFVGTGFVAIFILLIISVYLSLTFQVFAFENLKPVETLKRSIFLIDRNFWRASFLAIILFLITGSLIPSIFQVLIENNFLFSSILKPFNAYTEILISDPKVFMDNFPMYSTFFHTSNPANELAQMSFGTVFAGTITAFLLPMGSACYTLLYQDIQKRKSLGFKKKGRKKK